jgi:hypothetical protein
VSAPRTLLDAGCRFSGTVLGACALALVACTPLPTSLCPPRPAAPLAPARIVPAGRVAPFTLDLSTNPCGLTEDALSVVATVRGAGPGATVTVSEVRLHPADSRISMVVDVGTLPAGAYLLQVIVDPAVTSLTMPLLVATELLADRVERRTLSAPCDTPRVTARGTLLCAAPAVGPEDGWRVERPGAPPLLWPRALDVATAGDVVWVLDQTSDASVELRRLVDADGGLFVTHVGTLDARVSLVSRVFGVSSRRAIGVGWQFVAALDAGVLEFAPTPSGLESGRVVGDDVSPVLLDVGVGIPWCTVAQACFPSPVSGELLAADARVVWLSSPLLFSPMLLPLREEARPSTFSAVSRPLGADAGIVFTIAMPADVRPFAPADRLDVPGSLVFSADAGLFAARLHSGGLSLERLPPVEPVTVTPDWVVARPSPSEVELIRLSR